MNLIFKDDSHITAIAGASFTYCNSLRELILPPSIETIISLDSYLTNYQTLYVKSLTPPSLSGGFTKDLTAIYVPMESVDAYKSASGWSNYADIIVGYDW